MYDTLKLESPQPLRWKNPKCNLGGHFGPKIDSIYFQAKQVFCYTIRCPSSKNIKLLHR